MEAEIIAPIPKEVLKAELTEERRLRMTSKSNNEVYVVTWQNAPNVVREIGRLREIAFRAAGGGTGLDCDLDEFDTMENPYKQLIVWNPESEEIITEEGLTAREVTLGQLFEEAGEEAANNDDDDDSIFGIPKFLKK